MSLRRIFNNCPGRFHESTVIDTQVTMARDVYKNPIVATGIIFYTYLNGRLCILLLQRHDSDVLEDLGGKIERSDSSVLNAAIREVREETNGVIQSDDIWYYIRLFHNYENRENQVYYCAKSMYYCYLIEVSSSFMWDAREQMGYVEKHTGIRRTVDWYFVDTIHEERLAHRIRGILWNIPKFTNVYLHQDEAAQAQES
jgi:8-oxo-dGTP pyrophosphatase MutT (NUDIX family)